MTVAALAAWLKSGGAYGLNTHTHTHLCVFFSLSFISIFLFPYFFFLPRCSSQALKESFIKAIGTGLGFNLQRVEFHLSSEAPPDGRPLRGTKMHLDEEEEEDWLFEVSMFEEELVQSSSSSHVEEHASCNNRNPSTAPKFRETSSTSRERRCRAYLM